MDFAGNQFRSALVSNAMSSLRALLGSRGLNKSGFSSWDGRRDIESACGYIKNLDFNDYYDIWSRVDVAKRVVEAYPEYTWTQAPEVYEAESETVRTPFERDWEQHIKMNRPFSELYKLDILAGIGKYGLLVMGVNDGKSLDEPLLPQSASKQKKRVISYYRAYTEGEVEILEWDTDTNSPRFGQPVLYSVTPRNGAGNRDDKMTIRKVKMAGDKAVQENPNETTFEVHYTRVIHFADNALCGNIYGIERLKQVYNRMSDIIKIVGGSAEMFWQGAFSGIAFEMDAEAEIGDEAKDKMKLDIENYVNQLQRTLLLQGVKAKPLSPSIASPMDHLMVQILLVSIASKIPQRILAGSENGKLASTQDSNTWGIQVQTRRNNVATPNLVEPYVKFCILNGIVRSPKDGIYGFDVKWHQLNTISAEDKARSATDFTTALETYCSKALYFAMPFEDYLYHIFKFDSQESKEIAKKFDRNAFEKIRKVLEEKGQKPPEEGSKTAGAKQKSKAKKKARPIAE